MKKEIRDKLEELDRTVTAYDTNKQLIVIHGDGSIFYFSNCYFELYNKCLLVIPEHQLATAFHLEEVAYKECNFNT